VRETLTRASAPPPPHQVSAVLPTHADVPRLRNRAPVMVNGGTKLPTSATEKKALQAAKKSRDIMEGDFEVDEAFLSSARNMGIPDDKIIGALRATKLDYEKAASELIRYAQVMKNNYPPGTNQARPCREDGSICTEEEDEQPIPSKSTKRKGQQSPSARSPKMKKSAHKTSGRTTHQTTMAMIMEAGFIKPGETVYALHAGQVVGTGGLTAGGYIREPRDGSEHHAPSGFLMRAIQLANLPGKGNGWFSVRLGSSTGPPLASLRDKYEASCAAGKTQ